VERDETWTEDDPSPLTQFFNDTSRSIIATNDSPDVGFDASINPYRGCEHGCIYCYARPTHEYLGLSAGLDFESKIFVKREAPKLLRQTLMSPRWVPKVLAVSGVTDCYQPVERRLKITRQCMEVLLEFRNPAGIITKNALVARDIDLFREMAVYDGIHVTVSITSLRPELTGVMEPRASAPNARLEAIRLLADAGIPVGVNVAPIIPGLTDHEMPAILEAARKAGATSAGYTMVRLPYAVKELFQIWLSAHFPESKEKVLHRLREVRGGQLSDTRFGARMRGEGPYAEQIHSLFQISRRKAGYPEKTTGLSTRHFRRPGGPQLELFEV
jgi:DNA repair photolyase